jgi:hypothetical protein
MSQGIGTALNPQRVRGHLCLGPVVARERAHQSLPSALYARRTLSEVFCPSLAVRLACKDAELPVAARERRLYAGSRFGPVQESGASVYFRDPDGARLELLADPLDEMHGTCVL